MKRLWIAFALVMVLSFLVLGWIGTRIYQEMPPLPDKVVTTDGTVIVDEGKFKLARTCGNRLAAWKWGRCGDTAAMSLPTGPPIGCTEKRRSFSTAGPLPNSEQSTPKSTENDRLNFRVAWRK